jgi:sec-independent protein translocase protein TatA
MGIGYQELLIILALALLLFGGSRIPSLARSLGKSITEFKKGVQGIEDETSSAPAKEAKQSSKNES